MATVTTLSHRKGKNENISFDACFSYIYLYIPLYIIKWGFFIKKKAVVMRSFYQFEASTISPRGTPRAFEVLKIG